MKSLFYSFNRNIENAYIIRIAGNKTSVDQAKKAASSCKLINMPYCFWDAYDGISNPIVVPSHHGQFMKLLKITDHYLTRSEVACALSHISLWVRCVEIDQPIVILEHDAVMIKPYLVHKLLNSICYLGNIQQNNNEYDVNLSPPYYINGHNNLFIHGAFAYAIDPHVAKNMLSYVLKYGINGSLDFMINAHNFNIHQEGFYAYAITDNISTIQNRVVQGRANINNVDLSL